MTGTKIRKLKDSSKVKVGNKYYYHHLFKNIKINKFSPPIKVLDEDLNELGVVVVRKWKPLPNKKPIFTFIETSEKGNPKYVLEVQENCEIDGYIEDPVTMSQMLPLNNKNDNFTTLNFKMNKEYLSEDNYLLPELVQLFNESRVPNLDWDKMNVSVMNDNVMNIDDFRPPPQN